MLFLIIHCLFEILLLVPRIPFIPPVISHMWASLILISPLTLALEVFLIPHSYVPAQWLQDLHVVDS